MLRSLIGLLRGKGKTKQINPEEVSKSYDPLRMPKHIAIIMDGNGRWAQAKGLPRAAGHRAGVESLREVVDNCSRIGVEYLTVYAFSTENWKRPKEEVNILMDLLVEYLYKEVEELDSKNVRVFAIGCLEELPQTAQQALQKSMEKTSANTGLQLNLALNYGGRAEITYAVNKLARLVKEELINPDQIDQDLIAANLFTAGMPDPDLLIRPSGDFRVSNFLLWQLAYTEFWHTPVLWPDFRQEHLFEALDSYQKRQRRFGGLNI